MSESNNPANERVSRRAVIVSGALIPIPSDENGPRAVDLWTANSKLRTGYHGRGGTRP
jgi:hypothetical protein